MLSLIFSAKNQIVLLTIVTSGVTHGGHDVSNARVWRGQPADQDVNAQFAVIVRSAARRCTGVIISLEWVLTAAHCVAASAQAEVVIGVDSFSEIGERTRSYEVIVHPDYDRNVDDVDVKDTDLSVNLALIRLHDPILDPKMVIELEHEPWPLDMHYKYWRHCTVFGYGQHSSGESGVLRSRDIHAGHGNENCACFDDEAKSALICEPIIEDESLCKGDSGSPLVCEKKLVGIAHGIFNVRNCDRHPYKVLTPLCGEEHSLSTYIYLCPYLDWIQQHVKTTPTKPEFCRGFKQGVHIFIRFIMVLMLTL